ncbi:hypothetical protein TNCV_3224411 [Trichonephila clavipes]|nr:hypothetical protein TNCV_3224411 [Trichonephila clavipes]
MVLSGTSLPLLRLTEKIIPGFQSRFIGAIFLDIQKVFDQINLPTNLPETLNVSGKQSTSLHCRFTAHYDLRLSCVEICRAANLQPSHFTLSTNSKVGTQQLQDSLSST